MEDGAGWVEPSIIIIEKEHIHGLIYGWHGSPSWRRLTSSFTRSPSGSVAGRISGKPAEGRGGRCQTRQRK